MKFSFLVRQIANVGLTTLGHLSRDRVFFAMQLARRLPNNASRTVGAFMSKFPGPAATAASAWLLGQETKAKEVIRTSWPERPSRLLGEIALNLGMMDEAKRIAETVEGGSGLQSRILWTTGAVDEAIDLLTGRRRIERMNAERMVLQNKWWPKVDDQIVSRASPGTALYGSPSSMHILTNSLPYTRSGYTYRSHSILKTLDDAGHSVIAATRTSYPMNIGRLGKNDKDSVDGIDYLRHVPAIPATTPTERLNKQANWIADQALRREIDVLHTTTHYVNGLATGAAARAIGIPWVYEVRGVLEETWAAAANSLPERAAMRNSQRFELMRARELEVAQSADAVITLSETMRGHLVGLGVPSTSITIIPNSVSETVVNADVFREPSKVRAGLGLPEAGIWVGTAASIVGYEGLDDLVDAVILARAAGTDLRLLIAGDGVALPQLRERAAPLGENVVFSGRVTQLEAVELQLGLDVIVVPRKNEPVCRLVSPIKPIEAMGLARPVVVSDLPALSELVPTAAGVRTPPEDPVSLAEALVGLACEDETRIRLGWNGRNCVLATRRWKDIGRRYEEVYLRLREVDL